MSNSPCVANLLSSVAILDESVAQGCRVDCGDLRLFFHPDESRRSPPKSGVALRYS